MRYLFIAAHCDDLELSCWGTIAKLKEQGNEIKVLVFSHIYDEVNLMDELLEARKTIWTMPPSVHSFKCRNFSEQRQEILDILINWSGFDYVFTHSANSIHQDHKVVGEESLRAFKKSNLITYEHEWNLLQSESNYYIEVSEENMAKKLEAMACYKSQQHRPYFKRDFTYARALMSGAKIGVKFAEPFRIVNMRG